MPSETKLVSVGKPPEETFITTITQEIKGQKPYPTILQADRFCIPHIKGNGTLMKSLTDGPGAPLAGIGMQALAAVGGLRRVKPLLMSVCILGLVLSYAYLLILKVSAKGLVYTVLILLTLGFLLLGGAMLCTAFNLTGHQADSPIFKNYDHDEAVLYSEIFGGVSLLFGLIFLIVTVCARKTIETAVGCVQAACECMFAMPSLLMQPVIEAVVKVCLFFVLLRGFMWVLSCGDIKASTATIGGKRVSGLSRSFSYTEEEQYAILYYIFGYFWIMELCNALGLFTISYAVVLWYYTPISDGKKPSPRIPLLRGLFNGLFFHLGTLAFGAFLIAACRMIRLILAYIEKQAKATGNKVMEMIAKALSCCMLCFQRFLEFINKNAYIDVAINSSTFCTAAKKLF
eukprot:gnl/TRDRNA2_/TRDRNA2_176864_c3_seq1.p1 gnl/TRDRNA2_/TRDRNA2_176864_c3~~gnl/TRDRNA2_/TRDRNA2_176864_c3_seq1.p1  ORF type:complete len:463 (+),score=78.77 gnl/TRDRNA2_/TRDRNA2_176864_c3_seq1:188-1390(+)